MRVLLLTQVLPFPPDSGPAVKTWNVLKWLVQHHEVTLASFVRGNQSAAVARLEEVCRAVHTVPLHRSRVRDGRDLLRSLVSGQPFLMLRDDVAAMHALVGQLVGATDFDIVHADQLNMAQYAVRATETGGRRTVLDAHNALWLATQRLWQTRHRGPAKLLLQREWQSLRRYEGAMCRAVDAVMAVSEPDKSALEEAAGSPLRAAVVPICIDTHEVRPLARRAQADSILHLGTLLWPPNADGLRWFLRAVLPVVRAQRPAVSLDVVGARPPRDVRAWARREAAVRVNGYAADLQPFLSRAAVMVVPLRAGAGMRVRILEGLAQEMPIVTTSVGCEGIAVEHGRHLLVADDAAAFAEATLRLLRDPALAATLGRNGRALVEEQYDYRVGCRGVDEVYALAREKGSG